MGIWFYRLIPINPTIFFQMVLIGVISYGSMGVKWDSLFLSTYRGFLILIRVRPLLNVWKLNLLTMTLHRNFYNLKHGLCFRSRPLCMYVCFTILINTVPPSLNPPILWKTVYWNRNYRSIGQTHPYQQKRKSEKIIHNLKTLTLKYKE